MIDLKYHFPQSFFDEEERCGYTVSVQMKKIWAVELDMLNEFSRICHKHSIPFYICDGTLLGAVRHKGMIPWDDDIDVMMFRKDYEKLCEIGSKEFKHPYFFQTEYTDNGSLRGHAQLRNSETTGILKSERDTGRRFNQGIFIDIFPLDNVPDGLNERIKYLQTAKKLREQYSRKAYLSVYYKFKIRKNILAMGCDFIAHLIYRLFPSASFFNYKKAYERFEKYTMSYNQINTTSVVPVPFFREKDIKERSWFKETQYLPFESLLMPAPTAHDELLARVYGNYHKFVIGGADHGEVLFDTEKSYKEYLK